MNLEYSYKVLWDRMENFGKLGQFVHRYEFKGGFEQHRLPSKVPDDSWLTKQWLEVPPCSTAPSGSSKRLTLTKKIERPSLLIVLYGRREN